ncbi:MAG TPA: MATE family efflux transporter [Chromatiales bacterium]|nr:MATE family efflux transporter [Chromatiales bacterium]
MKPGSGRPRLTEGPVGKSIRSLMLPMLMGMVALISYNVADTWFIGRIGTMELAAISFTFPVAFVMTAITMSFGIGTSSVAARLFGADKRDEVTRVTLHAILLGLATGIVVLAIGILTIDPIFTLLGADDTTLPIIHRYMRIYYFGGIFMVMPIITNSVLRASGDAKTPAKLMTIAAIFNIVLDPIFIFGWMGIPAFGVEGAAISTVVSNAGSMVASVSIVYFRDKLIAFSGWNPGLILDSWKRILHVGIPSMTSSLIAPMTTAFITYQVAQFGPEAVAGFGVASRLEGLSLLALMALSAAATPFVGQNFGSRKFDRVRDGVHWCYRFSGIYGLSVAVALFIAAPWIAEAFTDSDRAIYTAMLQMRIVPISYVLLGVAMTVNGAFNAIGKPMPAMWVSLCRTVLVYAPLAFLLAHFFGLPGIFVAAATANIVAGSVGFVWFRSSIRKQMAEEQPVPEEAVAPAGAEVESKL